MRRPACTTSTVSPPISPLDPTHVTCLGARLPQERVGSFIRNMRLASNRLVVDLLLILQKCVPATLRCRAGGQVWAGLPSGGAGAGLCRVQGTKGWFSRLWERRRGEVNRHIHRAALVPCRSQCMRALGTLVLPLADPIACCPRSTRSRARTRVVGCFHGSRACLRLRPCLCLKAEKNRSWIRHISHVLSSYVVILGAYELSKRTA